MQLTEADNSPFEPTEHHDDQQNSQHQGRDDATNTYEGNRQIEDKAFLDNQSTKEGGDKEKQQELPA
ncbi:MAG: hypothetical protein M3R24_11860 [Chloroflexota bacterium]|nr:hypothetical protein [Chloroflexota bacterium]